MIDSNTIINTCYETTNSLRVIANYSHIIPVVLSLILGIFVFVKAKFNLFSKVFLVFIVMFSLWLIGDAIIWTTNNYYLVYAICSFLVYIEVTFYILGFYFATVFVKKSDISTLWKIALFVLTIPAFFITVTQQSVTGFNYSVCEAFNNNFLDQYKLILEGIILGVIFIYMLIPFFKKLPQKQKITDLVVLGSMFLFLSTFGITEYLASVTGYYEMNLYSLFLLPVFLIAIIYSVFELDIFNVKILGSHYLVVGFIIIMRGQLFFTASTTNKLLTILSLISLAGLSAIVFKNLKKESDHRVQIEKLNIQLVEAVKRETKAKENEKLQHEKFEELAGHFEGIIHILGHDVKNVLGKTRDMFVELPSGTFGVITDQGKSLMKRLSADTADLTSSVTNILKSGDKIILNPQPFDFKEAVLDAVASSKDKANEQKIKIKTQIDEKEDYMVTADRSLLVQHFLKNLIENAVIFNDINGSIWINLSKKDPKTVLLAVKGTGWGMTEDDKKRLFKQGGHGVDSIKKNVHTTGYGLFIAKQTIDAHNGKIYGTSEGRGKGSAFSVELPVDFTPVISSMKKV